MLLAGRALLGGPGGSHYGEGQCGGVCLFWGAQHSAWLFPDPFRSFHLVHPMWTEGHAAQKLCTKQCDTKVEKVKQRWAVLVKRQGAWWGEGLGYEIRPLTLPDLRGSLGIKVFVAFMAEKKSMEAGWMLRALNVVSQRPWGSHVEGEAAVPGGKQDTGLDGRWG